MAGFPTSQSQYFVLDLTLGSINETNITHYTLIFVTMCVCSGPRGILRNAFAMITLMIYNRQITFQNMTQQKRHDGSITATHIDLGHLPIDMFH